MLKNLKYKKHSALGFKIGEINWKFATITQKYDQQSEKLVLKFVPNSPNTQYIRVLVCDMNKLLINIPRAGVIDLIVQTIHRNLSFFRAKIISFRVFNPRVRIFSCSSFRHKLKTLKKRILSGNVPWNRTLGSVIPPWYFFYKALFCMGGGGYNAATGLI